ncbi:MAG: IS4 family transposase, partial [Sulfobacillus acidophilus]
HTTIVCLRYQLLAVAARDEADDRTIGTLFWAM